MEDWIFDGKEPPEVFVTMGCCWTQATINEVIPVDNIVCLPPELHHKLRHWRNAMEHSDSNMLPKILDGKGPFVPPSLLAFSYCALIVV